MRWTFASTAFVAADISGAEVPDVISERYVVLLRLYCVESRPQMLLDSCIDGV